MKFAVREFFAPLGRAVMIGFLCASLICAPVMLEGCSARSTVSTVIADMPTILNIAQSILAIVAAVQGTPAGGLASLQAQADASEKAAVTGLQTIQAVLEAYQQDLANAPASALRKISAAVTAINANLTGLETAFRVSDPKTQAAIGAVVTAVSGFLLGVESLVPAAVAAIAGLPQTARAGSAPYVMPSARTLAKRFNAAVGPLVPQAKVHVPWARVGPIPVLP